MVLSDKDIVDGPMQNAPDCTNDNLEDIFQHYRAELYRLQTFLHWPKQNIVTKEDLARNGFFYLGDGDRVKCAFCNVILKDWERGDNVEAEHRRHAERCPLVLDGLGGAQNIPYREVKVTERPAYPQYQDYNARLKTYEEYWPKSMKQRPRDLAAAGFFYLEKGDAVRCFQCAGLLRNWEPNDKPWEEHKHFFPRCPFLQQNPPSPRHDPMHQEMIQRFVTQISREYDDELVKKFEEYRQLNGCWYQFDCRYIVPEIRDRDQYKEEIEQFAQQYRIQQNTEPPDPAAAANSLASMNMNPAYFGASGGRDEVDGKCCVMCNKVGSDHHTFYPCSCTCCEKCVEHIKECPSCKRKVRAALSSTEKKDHVTSKPGSGGQARKNLNFGNSKPGMDE